MKTLKQTFKSKPAKVWLLIVLALVLFGNNLGEKKTGPTMSDCQSINNPLCVSNTNPTCINPCDISLGYTSINGCVTFLNDDLASKCYEKSCTIARHSEVGSDDYACVNCVPNGWLAEDATKCCSQHSKEPFDDKYKTYRLCTSEEDPDAVKSTCEGFQKTVSDLMEFTKISDCNTRFLAGMGIMFMVGILMLSAI